MSSSKKSEKGVERLFLLQMCGVQHKQKPSMGLIPATELSVSSKNK